jgi:hypothetical protein
MLYAFEKNGEKFVVKGKFVEKAASELGVAEKTIEDWIASRPELLFQNEQVLVIAQSVSGESMADVIALDSFGSLLVVEIKRDWSDRSTVSQLLEYAAGYKDYGYESFNQLAQKYRKWPGGGLIKRFREFAERPEFPESDLCKRQRVFIVAPDSDTGLKNIVDWLRSYGVPIEFIPFRLLADDQHTLRFIDIASVSGDIEPQIPVDDGWEWAGHWIFNTNETYAPGAYERMFSQNVIGIYGYDNGGANLEGSSVGQKVFAYVNGQGIRALGDITDANVKSGTGIFLDENNAQQPDEYHLSVTWNILLPPDRALSNLEASRMGYSLPVRTVFGRLRRGQLAAKIEAEIMKRAVSEQ